MSKQTKWVLAFTAAVLVLSSTAVLALESTEVAVPFRTRVQEILERHPEVKAELEALQEEYGVETQCPYGGPMMGRMQRRFQSSCGWGPAQRHMGPQRQTWAQ